ncbi:MAG TPA: hypothetical protein VN764_03875 [Polyangiaceae bacterium]|nr:hypothetical protein [Polyangiaceae bacterium]
MSIAESTLSLAIEVAGILKQAGVDPLLIGAAALAAHGYPRSTEDVDFAVAIPPAQLSTLARQVPGTAEYSEPDGNDPLGGVLTTMRDGGKVQIVNFLNPPSGGFPRLVQEALSRSSADAVGAKLVTLEDLILFKAYAGGRKSRSDVAELLVRTKPDMEFLKSLARQYRLESELTFVLDGLG